MKELQIKKKFIKLLIWVPSALLMLFFIPNALNKILHSNSMDKIVDSSSVMITTGIFLLVASSLFLYNKTILIGTFLLSLYMTFIVFIHMYKEKPYEIALLIIMATLFAAYIRKPHLFQ